MTRKFICILAAVALVAAGGAWFRAGVSRASADGNDDQGNNDQGNNDRDNKRPPQTLPQGVESTGRLVRDVEEAQDATLHSAWLVESSRFLNVPSGAFMPDRAFIPGSTDPKHNIPLFDFPANFGVIKG